MSSVSNEQILSAILALKQDMGGVQSVSRNAHDFAASASRKADAVRLEVKADVKVVKDELEAHVTNEDAHGAKGGRRTTDTVFQVITIGLGLLELIFAYKLHH